MTGPIYHLADPIHWKRSTAEYRTPSLDEDGFIHCSTATQLPGVARRLYMERNDLVLLTIDCDALDDQVLVFEDLYEEGEEYPHVYGSLPHHAVSATGPYLQHLEEGMWSRWRWDRRWLDRILHPHFAEVGRSGRAYARTEILDAGEEPFTMDFPLEDYRLELVDEDVAMARYISRPVFGDTAMPAQRTSIWVNTNDGWRMRFHQGTPLA